MPSKSIELFDLFEIEQNEQSRLLLRLKGKNVWQPFAAENGKTFILGGVTCFTPRKSQIEDCGAFFLTENILIYNNEYPNLSILLAKDIENGVTFDFGIIPISSERLTLIQQLLEEQIRMLYLSYLKPKRHSVRITTETVTEEIHD